MTQHLSAAPTPDRHPGRGGSLALDVDEVVSQGRFLTVEEAAEKVRVSRSTVRAWIRGDLLVVGREGRRVFVGERSLLDCELETRRSPMGRPRQGTSRGSENHSR